MSSINISQDTMSVLKNFVSINSSILVRGGNVLNTINVGENVIAEYDCPETFPQSFAIYDLNQFLSGLSLFENPSLVFNNDDYMIIKSETGSRSAKYYFSDPEITLKASPDKRIKFPDESVVSFKITQQDINSLQKASFIYDLHDVVFKTDDSGKNVIVSLIDRENDTNNQFELLLSGVSTGKYQYYMKMENLRLLQGDYMVDLTEHNITRWKNTNLDLVYYIAFEPV